MDSAVLGKLLDHLELAPDAPLPPPLRSAIVAALYRSRIQRDRLLALAADTVCPHGNRNERARELAKEILRFSRPEVQRRIRRAGPRDVVERLLVDAAACGDLPESARRLWDALPVDAQASTRGMVGSPHVAPRTTPDDA